MARPHNVTNPLFRLLVEPYNFLYSSSTIELNWIELNCRGLSMDDANCCNSPSIILIQGVVWYFRVCLFVRMWSCCNLWVPHFHFVPSQGPQWGGMCTFVVPQFSNRWNKSYSASCRSICGFFLIYKSESNYFKKLKKLNNQ